MEAPFLQVFVEGIKRYFSTTTPDDPVEVGVPYLSLAQDRWHHDITGIITVTGVHQGSVCFSAPRILLRHLLLLQGEAENDTSMCSDLVGEVANTIAGNARRSFGRQFCISTPQVVEGEPPCTPLVTQVARAFVIPLEWHRYRASLVISCQTVA